MHVFIHTLDTISKNWYGIGNVKGDNKMGRTGPEV